MTNKTKLNDLQLIFPRAASQGEDGSLLPLPEAVANDGPHAHREPDEGGTGERDGDQAR